MSSNKEVNGHRDDIDGLRAIAVLSVVLFHAGATWLPGGFVGVDVFFVISGYLITRILVNEVASGSYSIARFYVRRARRILPALYVVIVAVFLAGLWILLPLELAGLSRSIVATALFVSNFSFWKETGYFDTAGELKPLLHTWSLSVEEQFYVIWPLALTLLLRHRWRLGRSIFILAGLSFILSCSFVLSKPAAVFYLLPGRAWELLIGAWLATVTCARPASAQWRHGASIAGFILIAGSVLLLDKSMPFPAWNALMPCMGAALLIAAGRDGWINRHVLSNRLLVFIGLVSYSFYLWHWPLLSFVRILNLGQLPAAQAVAAVILSFSLAVLTWRFVETPFRRGGLKMGSLHILSRYALGGALLCVAGVVVLNAEGLPSRMPTPVTQAQNAATDVNSKRQSCHLLMEEVRVPVADLCSNAISGNIAGKSVAVWGDSHAESMVPGLSIMQWREESRLHQMTKTSCPPLLGASVLRGDRPYRECAEFNQAVYEYLRAHPEVSTVVLGARWPIYVLQGGFGLPEEIGNAPTYALVAAGTNDRKPAKNTSIAVFRQALGETVHRLQNLGKRVVIVGAVPEMKVDVPSCIARRTLTGYIPLHCDLAQPEVEARIGEPNAVIAEVAKTAGLTAIFPHQVLCKNTRCRVENAGNEIFYYDHNHLSTSGARFVFSQLMIDNAGIFSINSRRN